MTTEVFNIVIREDGSRVVKRNMEDIGRTGRTAASGIDLLKRALLGLGVAAIVRQFTNMLDVTTTINNRLRLVTNTTTELNAVYGELLRISNDTRTGLQSNADLFNRLSLSTRSLNLSYRQQLDLTEQLNKALVISGASASEGGAGLIQLSQGLASGALQGDELRSVLENLPRVAQVIAEEMGVTVGELRKLGADGKITAQTVVDAFANASDQLDAEFAKIAPTIESAFTVFNNQMLDFVRNANEASGIGEVLANVILFLADNFNAVVGAAAGLGIVLVGSLIPAVISLTVAMAANPIGLLVVAIAAATTAIGFFGDKTVEVGGRTATVWQIVKAVVMTAIDVFVQAREYLSEIWGTATESASGFFSSVTGWLKDFLSNWGITFDSVTGFVKKAVNVWIGLHVGFIQAVGPVITEGIPAMFNLAMGLAKNIVLDAVQYIVNLFVTALGGVGDALSYLPGVADDLGESIRSSLNVDFSDIRADTDALRTTFNETGAAITDNFGAALQRDYVGDFTDQVGQLGTALNENFQANLDSVIASQEDAVDLNAVLAGSYGGTTDAVNNLGDAAGGAAGKTADLNKQLEIQKRLLEDSVGARQEFIDTLAAVQTLLSDPTSGFTQSDGFGALSSLFSEDIFQNTQEAIQLQVEQVRLMYEQIDAMRQADVISEQTAAMAKAQANYGLIEQRLSGQKAFFGELAKLSRSENRKIAAIGKAAAVTQATIDGYLAIQKALASYPPPANYAIAAAIGATTAANVASILSQNTNFATGGSFVVPGSGGTDSAMVALRATPGERVSVQTPTQVRKGTNAANGGGGEGGGAAQVNQRIINVVDPAMVGDFLATPEGETVLVNVISRSGIMDRR